MIKKLIDMSLERTPAQWNRLLDTVKRNDDNVLNKIEQSYYEDEINSKINGFRTRRDDILEDIAAGSADISDIN